MPATQTPTDGPYAYPDSDRPGARSNTETTHHLTKIREYSEGDVAAAAVALGFELSAEEVAGFASVIQTTIEGLNLLGSYESIVAAGADRDSWVPQDNPYRAWYRQTEIQENDEGPLRGIRVAFKDNILVAGVPLSNGTSIFDGYRLTQFALIALRPVRLTCDAGFYPAATAAS
ncbi:MAG TPA: hypothetical protein VJ935_00955 [Acidimicrobiia bacterium]|nr:hypothetical protein [Acidimicrobiia bacterium]